MSADTPQTRRTSPPAIAPAIAFLVAGVVISAPGRAAPAGAADAESWSRWQDGRAELSGYRLSVSRYGQPRRGTAVLIYVTEPFSRSQHVKLDDPAKAPADAVEALKLNVVRRFQTGIYDYHTMLSVFVRSDDFSPLKITFTSAEWCGQVYEQIDFAAGRMVAKVFSYFEGESETRAIDVPPGGIAEDDLFVLLRGLRGAFLAPGTERARPFLPGAFHRRLAHRPLGWTSATITRLPEPRTIRVPAGSFATSEYVVRTAGGREGHYFIEAAPPHRVIRWTWSAPERDAHDRFLGGSESGELTGTLRDAYWTRQGPEDEALLRKLGL